MSWKGRSEKEKGGASFSGCIGISPSGLKRQPNAGNDESPDKDK
jgi:hypothetical protein